MSSCNRLLHVRLLLDCYRLCSNKLSGSDRTCQLSWCACCSFPGDDIPIIRGSALAALQGRDDEIGK